MWRGTGPTVLRLSLGAGINFVVLEKLKATMLHVRAQVLCFGFCVCCFLALAGEKRFVWGFHSVMLGCCKHFSYPPATPVEKLEAAMLHVRAQALHG